MEVEVLSQTLRIIGDGEIYITNPLFFLFKSWEYSSAHDFWNSYNPVSADRHHFRLISNLAHIFLSREKYNVTLMSHLTPSIWYICFRNASTAAVLYFRRSHESAEPYQGLTRCQVARRSSPDRYICDGCTQLSWLSTDYQDSRPESAYTICKDTSKHAWWTPWSPTSAH